MFVCLFVCLFLSLTHPEPQTALAAIETQKKMRLTSAGAKFPEGMALEGDFKRQQAMVVRTCNPSALEAKTGRSLSSRPAWSTGGVPGLPGLHRKTVSKKGGGHYLLITVAMCTRGNLREEVLQRLQLEPDTLKLTE